MCTLTHDLSSFNHANTNMMTMTMNLNTSSGSTSEETAASTLEKDYYGCYCLKFIVKNGTHITEEKVIEDFGAYGEVVDVRGPGLFSGLRGNHVYVRFIERRVAELVSILSIFICLFYFYSVLLFYPSFEELLVTVVGLVYMFTDEIQPLRGIKYCYYEFYTLTYLVKSTWQWQVSYKFSLYIAYFMWADMIVRS